MKAAALALLLAAAALLGPTDGGGWKQATPDRPIVLPADQANHSDYKVEWWYYTGNLDAADGRRFGYQLTFFRVGVDREPATRSRWAVRDLFMAHFAISDIDSRTYRFAERLNRSGPGWAGAASGAYRVWNERWLATAESPSTHHLVAADAQFGIDVTVDQDRPAVLHGRNGYSQKGADPGNASHYYSFTRMTTMGTIVLGGRAIPVSGLSWMDHEFGTSFLEPQQRGWDWLALQLDDGRDLMVYQLRRADGGVDPHSSATLVEPDGRATTMRATDFSLQPGRTWTSRASGATYPVAWRVRVPSAGADLQVAAALDDQELRARGSSGVTYWEGAIDVRGQMRGRDVKGRGYLEMTGYAGGPLGRMFESGR